MDAIRREIATYERATVKPAMPNGRSHSPQTVTDVSDRINPSSSDVGARIRRARGGRSQRSLGHALDISPMTLIRYERGERAPDAGVLAAICRECGVTADWLLFGIGDGPASSTSPATGTGG